MSSATSPALPAFSYAQAARGLTPSQTLQPKSPESRTHTSDVPAKEVKTPSHELGHLDLTSSSEPSGVENVSQPHAAVEAVVEQKDESRNRDSIDKENVAPVKNLKQSAEENGTDNVVSTSPGSTAPSSSQMPSYPESSAVRNETTELPEKQPLVTSPIEDHAVERSKGKDEEDWEKISLPAAPSEKELKPAPPPPINYWQQRKAELDAKTTQTSNQRASVVSTSLTTAKNKMSPTGSVDDTKWKSSNKVQAPGDRDTNVSKRKQQDSSKPADTSRREPPVASSTRPTSSHRANPEPQAPPPVGDAESWPTPDTTIEERRKSISLEKGEKLDAKNNGTKLHGNKWKQLPFVPTAVFETQLPPAAARRGGRPSTRGRGGLVTGGNATSEKPDGPTSMGPPPLPRQANEQDRGRRSENSRGGRAASVPTQGNRADSISGPQVDARKGSETTMKERGGHSQPKANLAEAQNLTIAAEEQTTNSVPDKMPALHSQNLTANSADISAGKGNSSSDNSHAHPIPDSEARNVPPEWQKGSGNQVHRNPNDSAREKGFHKTREAQREKPEFTREKVESWRDRDQTGEQTSRREGRPERGRASYRGRGSHNAYGTHPPTTHSYTAPLPQQAFAPTKSNSFHENRHRQSSQQYPSMQSLSGNRTNTRSQSIPTTNMFQPFTSSITGLNQPLSPIQTDMPMYGYGQIHPGVMSAMPYQSHLELYSLISMVSVQVEYYFSIDNLCKDMYLRRNMDSQGFVPLGVIAGFKRIQTLVHDDLNLLRHVCTQLKSVEFLPGDNGEEDRLRRRDKWHEFVIDDIQERFPAARNDGPTSQSLAGSRSISNGYPKFNDPYFASVNPMRSPTYSQNAYSGPPQKLSPTANPAGASFTGIPSKNPAPTILPDFAAGESVLQPDAISPPNGHDDPGSPDAGLVNGQTPVQLNNGFQSNGYHPQANVFQNEDEDVFPNESIANLRIVTQNSNDASINKPPFISNATRTFSNGSIDGTTDSREFRGGFSSSSTVSGLRGGAGSAEQLESSQLLQTTHVGSSIDAVDSPPVYWAKGEAPPLEVLQHAGMNEELYLAVRDRALQQHMLGNSSDAMELLYQFWSHFLVRNFNVGIYEEFHTLALTDLQKGVNNGSKHLIRYYEEVLLGKEPLSDRLAHDIVAMAGSGTGDSTPLFHKLRSAWRNGAFNLKSRKKIGDILSPALRAELEK